MPLFDKFIFVDWSANSSPKTGKDSIWIAQAVGPNAIRLDNPATREEATRQVLRSLQDAVEQKQRVLLGFDFAYSYPQAVLQHTAAHQGPSDFPSLWNALHAQITDGVGNANNRFAFAAWANEHWFGHRYYWGCFPGQIGAWLTKKKDLSPLTEKRLTEQKANGTRPTRQLAYAGCVGSQALLGMRRLHELRNNPALAGISHVWPMETGFALPPLPAGIAAIVHAEIYPTPVIELARAAGIAMPMQVTGMVSDAQQVWACAELARHEDGIGTLAQKFARPGVLRGAQVGQAESEGWILWS